MCLFKRAMFKIAKKNEIICKIIKKKILGV